MAPYGSKELAQSFRTVRKNTLEAARDIPEDKYDFCPAPDCRNVEKLLTHIALGYRFQHRVHAVEKLSSMEGFDFAAVMAELGAQEATPRTKSQVIELLEDEGEIWAAFLDGVSDEFLAEAVSFPPEFFAAVQESAGVDSIGERARDAPPRPGHADPADAGHCPAPHAAAGSAHGPDTGSRGRLNAGEGHAGCSAMRGIRLGTFLWRHAV